MRRPNQNQAEAPGQDSFLDVVANLVGIMIILIMVVGIGTKKAFVAEASGGSRESTDESSNDPAAPSSEQVDAAAQTAASIESDMHQMADRIQRQQIEVAYRRAERDKLLTLLAAAEKGLDDRRQKYTEQEREQIALERQLAAKKQELEELEKARLVAERMGPPPGVIEHLPTPMAKTVFGHEYHFRLGGGRLAFIPWDDFVERLKSDAPQKMQRLRDQSQITESVGPHGGFVMKYTLKRVEHATAMGGGVSVQQRVELDRFTLLPIDEQLGEPLEQALRPNSDFFDQLAKLDPAKSTITVWVYPDSYHQFRDLKKLLFDRGYLAAARPLPEGHPIGASPDGSRSSAQ